MSDLKQTFSRKSMLAGGAALAMLGMAGGAFVGQSTTPAFAQDPLTAPESTRQPVADFADLVEAVSPAVVSIQVESRSTPRTMSNRSFGGSGLEDLPENHPLRRFFDQFGDQFGQQFGMPGERQTPRTPRGMPRQQSLGSGFIISADGYVVTNNHVVEQGDNVKVVMNDSTEYDAELVGTDPKTDLALLKIDVDHDLPFVNFTQDAPRVGSWVVAVGNPFGLSNTVTAGIVSARGRDIGAGPYDDFIQIDAPVNRGNSGGPTFNLDGEVIGINTAIFAPGGGGNVGIAFAIPASTAVAIIEDLKQDGQVSRGWLGVQIQPVTEEIASSLGLDQAKGAIVAETLDTGPAGDAGLQSGDVILSVNGQEIADSRALVLRIGEMKPNEDAELEIYRDGEVMTVDVTLGAQPSDGQQVAANDRNGGGDAGELGLALSSGPDGVTVAEVEPGSEGDQKGLQPGDIILQAGGREVSSPRDVVAAVEAARENGRDAVLLRVRSGENTRFVALSLNA
ncbi:Do family serine endopeptidase [Lutibaculum baratangense]|uniref:Probable periplasmic serine endoprotease DegP-like n=1 Tax=Lutibaculum baratangense AMV1 TaxID=631454 RepID=V4QSR6_9HYPH|nr:Do family serine endopeptidase [Lutibaculum baratangense]ESR22817.1 HtrA protease/chaperone protein [Lutibaculum baratangense AMV1]